MGAEACKMERLFSPAQPKNHPVRQIHPACRSIFFDNHWFTMQLHPHRWFVS
jgi:hypothetical protein